MRFYRALLRLYPESFRADYAAELARTFEDNARNRGRVGAMMAAIADVVPNALAVHWAILLQDLRFTARTLNGSRGFAIAAVLITALGVGANTATFSVADFVLLRPLPYHDPNAIVRLCEGPRDGSGWGCMNELSPANFRSAATETRSFEGWGAFTGASVNMVGSGEPVRLGGYRVMPEVFSVLGVAPMIGRTFDTTQAGAADASSLVLSWALWQTQFGGDPQVLGQTLRPQEVIDEEAGERQQCQRQDPTQGGNRRALLHHDPHRQHCDVGAPGQRQAGLPLVADLGQGQGTDS